MKQNVSETESNQLFQKNVKKSVSDGVIKTWPFSSNFNFAGKGDQVTLVTCKYCWL